MMRYVATAVFLGLLSSAAQAGRGGGGPCVEDARKYCSGVSVAGGKLQECLKNNLNQLSDSCKAQVGGVKSSAKAAGDSCAAEFKKVCAGVGPMEMPKCIKENAAKLPQGCKDGAAGLKGSLIPN